MDDGSKMLSLTSTWYIAAGREQAALAALEELAAAVLAAEPETLAYLVHTSFPADERLVPRPPPAPGSVVFFEVYRSVEAFLNHVNGPVFTGFVARNKDLFVNADGGPFTTVQFLVRRAGFIRPAAVPTLPAATGTAAPNQHPPVMFEIMARDQEKLKGFYQSVFGWSYELGTGDFAYVKFPVEIRLSLGGIGQSQAGVPGWDPGHTFYLLVDDLEASIERAVAAGGARFVKPITVDGYQFAIVKDPDGNPIGLIKPWQ